MSWNNKKLEELYSKNNRDSQKIYDDYEDRINEPQKEQPINQESDIKKLFEDLKESKEVLRPYKVIIGDEELPVTPEKILFQNPVEEKKYKTVTGMEIITGLVVLPTVVSFNCYFPYYKLSEKNKTPLEYIDYFKKLKNKREKIQFKVEGSRESFYAYVTTFDYELIPGRDIDYSMILMEHKEVNVDEIDL